MVAGSHGEEISTEHKRKVKRQEHEGSVYAACSRGDLGRPLWAIDNLHSRIHSLKPLIHTMPKQLAFVWKTQFLWQQQMKRFKRLIQKD